MLKKKKANNESNTHHKKSPGKRKATQVVENEYAVEKILDKKEIKGKILYFVKWEGYPDSDNTWEPIEHLLNVIDMVEDFEANLKEPEKKAAVPSRRSSKVAPESAEKLKKANENEKGLKERDLNREEEVIVKKRKTSVDSSHKNAKNAEEFTSLSLNTEKPLLSSDFDLSGAKVVVNGDIRSQMEKVMAKPKKQKEEKIIKKKESSQKENAEDLSDKENNMEFESSFPTEKVVMEEETEKITLEQEKLEKWNNITTKLNVEVNQEKVSLTDYSYKSSNDDFETPKVLSQNVLRISQRQTEEIKMNYKLEGGFDCDDKPKRILSIRQRKKGFWFLVEWEERDDGIQPQNSFVTNEEMKDYAPKFLAEFYESKIKVLKDSKEKEDIEGIEENIEEENNVTREDDFLYSDDERGTKTSTRKKKVVKSGPKTY